MTNIDMHINPSIITHFLHVMYCNYIKIIMDQFSFEKRHDIIEFISNKEEPLFWNNYELFTFGNKKCNLNINNIWLNNDISDQINNDFMMVDIYEKNYKHYDYLREYALHTYCQNKENIRKELLTYIESCVGLK